jgi:hypothetical protein
LFTISIAGNGITLNIDNSGSYSILVDNHKWFDSGGSGFFSNGKYFTGSSLQLVSQRMVKGVDAVFGVFEQTILNWVGSNGIPYETAVC